MTTLDLTYDTEQVTMDFVMHNPGLQMPDFTTSEALMKYRRLTEELPAHLVKSMITYLDDTDSARKAVYVEARRRLGNRTAPKGDKWGAVNTSTACGGGLRMVSCEGHGGFLISQARQSAIPMPLRDNECAYEEDGDYAIIGALWPESMVKYNPEYFVDRRWARRLCVESLVRWRAMDLASILSGADVV